MTPKDMTWLERYERDRRWSSTVNFGSPMSVWTTTMLEVRRDMGQPNSPHEVLAQEAEVRRRDAARLNRVNG